MRFLKLILVIWLWALLPVFAAAQVQSVGVAGAGEFTRITIQSQTANRPDVFLRDTDDGSIIEKVPERWCVGAVGGLICILPVNSSAARVAAARLALVLRPGFTSKARALQRW